MESSHDSSGAPLLPVSEAVLNEANWRRGQNLHSRSSIKILPYSLSPFEFSGILHLTHSKFNGFSRGPKGCQVFFVQLFGFFLVMRKWANGWPFFSTNLVEQMSNKSSTPTSKASVLRVHVSYKGGLRQWPKISGFHLVFVLPKGTNFFTSMYDLAYLRLAGHSLSPFEFSGILHNPLKV